MLRLPELADAKALMEIVWDPEVVEQKQVTLLEPPGGLDLALKNTGDMRRQWELRGYGQWCVIETVTGDVIGIVGFYHPQRPWPGVDLGWVIQRSRWGNGFATEAATAALKWIRNALRSTASSASSLPMMCARFAWPRRSVNVSSAPTRTPCTANPCTSTR